MNKQDDFIKLKSDKIYELEKELQNVNLNNKKLKEEINANAIKVQTTTNHMNELQVNLQTLDNKIKLNKSKEDQFKSEIKKHYASLTELESTIKTLTQSKNKY